jgi:hypothetical protein
MNKVTVLYGCGKADAALHHRFVGAYKICKTERGTFIEGGSPDGRHTGTCDRCGTAIMNIYVFRADSGSLMHVGIDCAQKMGVPLDELKKARYYFRNTEREAQRARERESLKERQEREAADRAERLRENAEVVEFVTALQNTPGLTEWQTSRLGDVLRAIANEGMDWLDSSGRDSEKLRDDFASITEGVALQKSSAPFQVAPKAITGEFRAFRPPVVIGIDSPYGPSFLNFLTLEGRVFVYKGKHRVMRGDRIRATFSLGEGDEYNGTFQYKISRPRKATICRAWTVEDDRATAERCGIEVPEPTFIPWN